MVHLMRNSSRRFAPVKTPLLSMLLTLWRTSAVAGDTLSAGHQKSKLRPNRIIEYRTQTHTAEEMSVGRLMMESAADPAYRLLSAERLG